MLHITYDIINAVLGSHASILLTLLQLQQGCSMGFQPNIFVRALATELFRNVDGRGALSWWGD